MKINKIKAQLEMLSLKEYITPEKMSEWCNVVSENYSMFEGKDWNSIYEALGSFKIDGVDDQIKRWAASAIAEAEDTDMNTDEKVATIFFAYAKKNIK